VRYPLQPHYRREHWPLINGVYPLADGTVAASLRSVSAVIIIDRASGEISWRLGPDMLPERAAGRLAAAVRQRHVPHRPERDPLAGYRSGPPQPGGHLAVP
jgi:hypothetical protein